MVHIEKIEFVPKWLHIRIFSALSFPYTMYVDVKLEVSESSPEFLKTGTTEEFQQAL